MAFLPTEVAMEAKRRVHFLSEHGRLITPRDAWLLSGETKSAETLWSVSFNLGRETDCSPELINEYLEKTYPLYTSRSHESRTWDDFQP